jgi:hypothetical protein
MEVFEDKGHRGESAGVTTAQSQCATPGCTHPPREASGTGPSAGLCACCYRRSLEKRLSQAQTEASLLPGEIARLPRDCLREVRPHYERLLT